MSSFASMENEEVKTANARLFPGLGGSLRGPSPAVCPVPTSGTVDPALHSAARRIRPGRSSPEARVSQRLRVLRNQGPESAQRRAAGS
ncbi:hypothetical protein TREES_T100013401 [Tupaia chinensis]|uniref:Uncharacterized protein n=1 Tax=Tupaia chinensis TaxID=246437 RepID=L9JC21_TUPCH|nr:hypothetical protein TREES_T100013401 [Tupaia chinensis]